MLLWKWSARCPIQHCHPVQIVKNSISVQCNKVKLNRMRYVRTEWYLCVSFCASERILPHNKVMWRDEIPVTQSTWLFHNFKILHKITRFLNGRIQHKDTHIDEIQNCYLQHQVRDGCHKGLHLGDRVTASWNQSVAWADEQSGLGEALQLPGNCLIWIFLGLRA